MFATGKCWKKNGWIISLYQRIGDQYITMRMKKAKPATQEGTELKTHVKKTVNDISPLEYETVKGIKKNGNV